MNFLPLGTVVTLKNIDRTIMINGYLPNVVGKEINTFDYVGIIFPEGNLINGNTLYFNDDSIDKVLFRGYESDEFNEFLKRFNEDSDTVKALENNEPVTNVNYEFNDDGVVINDGIQTIESPTIPDDMAKSIYIFDENGVVIEERTPGENNSTNNGGYQFDENGIVIEPINDNNTTSQQSNGLIFDENGVVVEDNTGGEISSTNTDDTTEELEDY